MIYISDIQLAKYGLKKVELTVEDTNKMTKATIIHDLGANGFEGGKLERKVREAIIDKIEAVVRPNYEKMPRGFRGSMVSQLFKSGL